MESTTKIVLWHSILLETVLGKPATDITAPFPEVFAVNLSTFKSPLGPSVDALDATEADRSRLSSEILAAGHFAARRATRQ